MDMFEKLEKILKVIVLNILFVIVEKCLNVDTTKLSKNWNRFYLFVKIVYVIAQIILIATSL